MNGIIVELLLGLYFIGTGLPPAIVPEQANRRYSVLVFGVLLLILVIANVDLTTIVRR